MRNQRFRGLIVLGLAILIAPTGCGYTLRSPYNKTVKTVYLPTFRSTRFRRDLNTQLTELVKDEIQNRTSFRIVGTPEGADATLLGTVSFDDKALFVESPNNLPRQYMAVMYATVTFVDNRTGERTTRKTTPDPFSVVAEGTMAFPEIGETTNLAFQKTMQRMAKDIVNMMEDPWGEEYRPDIDAPPPPDAEEQADAARIPKPRTSLLR